MSIDSGTISLMGHHAHSSMSDLEAKYLELANLQAQSDVYGLSPELKAEISGVQGDIDRDYEVIKVDENLTQILVVEQKVQEQANKRQLEKAAEMKQFAADQHAHLSPQTPVNPV